MRKPSIHDPVNLDGPFYTLDEVEERRRRSRAIGVDAEEGPAQFATWTESEPWLSLEVQCSLPSRANLEKNHWERQKLVKEQRSAVDAALLPFGILFSGDDWCWTVRITRVSAKRLDHDNAYGATKAIQDSVARFLGYDDADDHIVWLPVQQRKDPQKRPKYQAAQIEIWIGHQTCPCCQTMVVPRKVAR